MTQQLKTIEDGLDIASRSLGMKDSAILYTAFQEVSQFVNSTLEDQKKLEKEISENKDAIKTRNKTSN